MYTSKSIARVKQSIYGNRCDKLLHSMQGHASGAAVPPTGATAAGSALLPWALLQRVEQGKRLGVVRRAARNQLHAQVDLDDADDYVDAKDDLTHADDEVHHAQQEEERVHVAPGGFTRSPCTTSEKRPADRSRTRTKLKCNREKEVRTKSSGTR